MTDALEIRSADIEYREDSESGYLEGIAVPYGQIANIGGAFQERFENGSVEPEGTVWLYHQHKTPIGVVEATEHRAEGFFIRAKLALSDLAKTTREQLRNGSLKSLSVGFIPVEHRDEDGVKVITRARLREVSVVAKPAYSLALVTHNREDTTDDRTSVETNHPEGSEMTDSTVDLTEVREEISELSRRFDAFTPAAAAPAVDTRSAAAALIALSQGDETVTRSYNETNGRIVGEQGELLTRAYTGGTTADAPMQNVWVGDITRVFDNHSGILSETFSRGTLPNKGNVLEYGKLLSKSGKIGEQVNEGDDLPYLNLKLTTATTEVHTYGGYTQLSFQAIERSTMPLLQRNLEHLAVEASAHKAKVLRADFDAVVAANRGIASNNGVVLAGAALGAQTPATWLKNVLAANRRFKAQGYGIDKLIVTEDVFEHLLQLTTSGERLLRVAEGNTAGSANVKALTATLYGVPVEVDDTPTSAVSTGQAVFVNGAGIRQYDSALVSLQDSNIINLTKDFSVYRYGAIADEQPSLIVPVKFAAS